jgi:hypothetical protein
MKRHGNSGDTDTTSLPFLPRNCLLLILTVGYSPTPSFSHSIGGGKWSVASAHRHIHTYVHPYIHTYIHTYSWLFTISDFCY